MRKSFISHNFHTHTHSRQCVQSVDGMVECNDFFFAHFIFDNVRHTVRFGWFYVCVVCGVPNENWDERNHKRRKNSQISTNRNILDHLRNTISLSFVSSVVSMKISNTESNFSSRFFCWFSYFFLLFFNLLHFASFDWWWIFKQGTKAEKKNFYIIDHFLMRSCLHKHTNTHFVSAIFCFSFFLFLLSFGFQCIGNKNRSILFRWRFVISTFFLLSPNFSVRKFVTF